MYISDDYIQCKTYCVAKGGVYLSRCDMLLLGHVHKELVLQEKEEARWHMRRLHSDDVIDIIIIL